MIIRFRPWTKPIPSSSSGLTDNNKCYSMIVNDISQFDLRLVWYASERADGRKPRATAIHFHVAEIRNVWIPRVREAGMM